MLEIVNLEYHETIMAGAGAQAEEALEKAMKNYKGEYILVVEGAVSTKDGGIYCQIGGKPTIQILKDVSKDAKLIIAYHCLRDLCMLRWSTSCLSQPHWSGGNR